MFNSPNLLSGEHTIAVTRAERDWLYDERVRAIRTFPNITFHLQIQQKEVPFPWLCALRIYRRDKDGSLLAAVVLQEKGSKSRYIRKLRVPAAYGSTGDRELYLRRRRRAA